MPIVGTIYDDMLFGADGDDSIQGLDGNDFLDGGSGSDGIDGGSGDDIIVGSIGAGSDIYNGGDGHDFVTYYEALGGVRVNLALAGNHAQSMSGDVAGIGIDQLLSIENVEGSRFNDTLTGSFAANLLVGAEGNDTISGAGGDDVLVGGQGDDSLNGGAGMDTADYSEASHAIYVSLSTTGVQSTGMGRDTLVSIERLIGGAYNDVLGGSVASNEMYGGAGNDRLTGGAGNDLLDGGSGVDRMTGGSGNDTLVVDHASDVVLENVGEGTDTVIVTIAMSYALGANFENLTVTAPSSMEIGDSIDDYEERGSLVALTGNAGNNVLTAAGGANVLDGGAGADRMIGGSGSDFYFVDNVGDRVIEFADPYDDGDGPVEVSDTVYSSVSFTLGDYVEHLYLSGTANLFGYGNAGDNRIDGNAGANSLRGYAGNDELNGGDGNDTLDGGAGADTLFGSLGNDTYIVDDAYDQVYENFGEGTDIVKSSVTFGIWDGIENLTLTGAANIDGFGNSGDNLISGNEGANSIYAGAGNDVLYGRGGSDLLSGELGDDILSGGTAKDNLLGGEGADIFTFDDGEFGGLADTLCDAIGDFNQADNDRIRLIDVDANSTLSGDQAFTFIGDQAFSGAAGELRVYQANGYSFVAGDTDGNGSADFLLAVFCYGATLSSGDFLL